MKNRNKVRVKFKLDKHRFVVLEVEEEKLPIVRENNREVSRNEKRETRHESMYSLETLSETKGIAGLRVGRSDRDRANAAGIHSPARRSVYGGVPRSNERRYAVVEYRRHILEQNIGNSQAKRPDRYSVDACFRAPRTRLVSQIGHYLAQDKRSSGERERPTGKKLRTYFSFIEIAEGGKRETSVCENIIS